MYPLLKGKQSHFPIKDATGGCSFCKGASENGFVGFSAGALQAGPTPGTFFPLSNGIAWFDLFDHGVTKHGRPLHVVTECSAGQFEFYFCSTKCMRSFFNKLVDDFENL
jgi:hypothetical protein